MEQMQGLDASFVAMEQPDAPVHIGSMVIYDPSTAPGGFVRYKDILSFIESRLHLAKSMRQKMVKVPFGIDYPYWVQDINFDLEYHVRHVALPKPGDWRQLCIQSARIFARPLDLHRPPWEITIIEGLDNVEGVPKGSYAMLSKVHHAAIDGVSGVDMMTALHTIMPSTEPPTSVDEWRPESDPSQIGMFMRGYTRSMINPWRQANAMRKSLPGLARAAKGFVKKEFDFKALIEAPKTRFNGTVSPHRMFDAKAFPLDEIKLIRNLSPGSKLNDVMLSIVGGSMRRYLKAKNELPKTTCTAMAPISVRSESEKNALGNQVSAMFVPLGSHLESADDRMRYVHEETGKAKGLTNALGARQTSEMAKLAPQAAMNIGASLATRFKLADHVKPVINTVVTNVPGPPIPIYSAGAQMIGVYGLLCLVDGMRLGHIVQSYCGTVTLSFTADRDAVPDPDFYAECMQKSFDDHLKLAKAVEKSQEKAAPKTVKTKVKTTVKKPTKAKTAPKPRAKRKNATKANGVQKPLN